MKNRKKYFKSIAILLFCVVMIFMSGCANSSGQNAIVTEPEISELSFITMTDGIPHINRYTSELTFYSSDEEFSSFLNDFYSRHIRSGENAIGIARMGACWSYAKDWESISLDWFDAGYTALEDYDASALMRNYINNIDIDKFGNAYVWFNDAQYTSTTRAYDMPGQGWPFPDYSEVGTYGSEFNESADNWTINGEKTGIAGGYLAKEFKGKTNQSLVFESPKLAFEAELSPFVEVMLLLGDHTEEASLTESSVADFAIEWKRKDSKQWYSVTQSEFASNPYDFSQNTKCRSYLPLYLHPEWKGTIEAIKISIIPKKGEALDVNAQLDYFRCASDTRQSTSSAKYILTLEEYASFHNDLEILKNNINRARQTLMFMLHALQGENGLVRLDYLSGHDSGAGLGHRIGNGYYDIYPPCNLNLEANLYFYESLRSMARMEQMLLDAGIKVETTTVANPYPYGEKGEKDITYHYTPAQLLELAEEVKENCQKDYTDGGFWNPETGRFAWGIYDENSPVAEAGEPLDYGMTETNIRMVYSGLATEEQAKSIYEWLDGSRIVEGDDSTGEDIYFYDFAARSTTKDNKYDYTSIYVDQAFGKKVQDGGSILYTSFYDIIARMGVNGVDDAFERYKEIGNWYEEVRNAGGSGTSFYQTYYLDKQLEAEDGDAYTLQGGGWDGAMGIDNEFYESAMIYAATAYGFFGLDASYNTLYLSPKLPKKLSYMAMTNLMFSDVRYECLVTGNSVVLSGIESNSEKLNVQVTFDEPKEDYKVLLNGSEYTNYTVCDGKIIVEMPFANGYLQIR